MFSYVLLACFATSAVLATPKARIAGSHDVDIQHYPYHVQLHLNTSLSHGGYENLYSGCNGAIITARHVLTTATCINPYLHIQTDASSILVKVNASIIYEYHNEPATFVQVESYTIHPYHSNDNDVVAVDYNIGVLELSEPLQFGAGIQSIGLPKQNELPAVGSVLSVTGFGAKNYGGVLDVKSQLQALQTLVVANTKCTEDFIGSAVITERQVCTGALSAKGQQGPCEGDDGSPAAFEGVLYGLYTFGDCGNEGHGSVYTSLGGLVGFINDAIAASNDD